MASSIPGRVLRKSVRVVSAGGAFDDLEIGPVPFGEQWLVRRVASMDDTNVVTKRGYAVKTGSYLYWLHETLTVTLDLRHGEELNTLLVAGESLIVRLTGCTNLDVLWAWLTGEYWEVGEE